MYRKPKIIFVRTIPRATSRVGPIAFLIIALFVIAAVLAAPKLHLMAKITAKRAKFSATLLSVEKDSVAFAMQTALINRAPECFPIEISGSKFVKIQYQFCSEEALRRDSQAVMITEQFSVSSALARRYNFWRRIYSVYGKHQYVMHLSEWPEVILAVYDSSDAPGRVGESEGASHIKKVTDVQKKAYSYILNEMHRRRNSPKDFSYTMERIAKSMAHIADEDKYLKAAKKIRLQRGQRDFIAKGLHTAPKYLAAIESEFVSIGVPKELSLLAFVESSFNTKAFSKVGASGVYQIMKATGKQYLHIGSNYDERNDPIKAGRAAARILKHNYDIAGSWPLAITAYNHGIGGIKRAVERTQSSDLARLIEHYQSPSFGFASKNFYAGFLGLLATLSEKDRHFPHLPKVAPLAYRTIRLEKSSTAASIKESFNVSSKDFAELNLDLSAEILRGSAKIPAGYLIKIPDPHIGGFGLLTQE